MNKMLNKEKGGMRIGACGIACELCGLFSHDICEGCMPGTAEDGETRVDLLKQAGVLCPPFACAVNRRVSYCSMNCDKFPCEKYKDSRFPYSRSFLEMYERRKS